MNITPPLPASLKSLLVAGGSFDPPHRAHINLTQQAAITTNCDHILYVIANRSPHKQTTITPGIHRIAMLNIALENTANTSVTTFELDNPPPSYTVNTLIALRSTLSNLDITIRLLIGSDQLKSFKKWYQWETILELAQPVVVLRPPDTLQSLKKNPHIDSDWLNWFIDTPLDTVSSTEIRNKIIANENVQDLLNKNVLEYIKANKLYNHP